MKIKRTADAFGMISVNGELMYVGEKYAGRKVTVERTGLTWWVHIDGKKSVCGVDDPGEETMANPKEGN